MFRHTKETQYRLQAYCFSWSYYHFGKAYTLGRGNYSLHLLDKPSEPILALFYNAVFNLVFLFFINSAWRLEKNVINYQMFSSLN